MLHKLIVISILAIFSAPIFAFENNQVDFTVPLQWQSFQLILENRSKQTMPKMKLTKDEVVSFINFLNNLKRSTPELLKLQQQLPKTTLELLRAVESRGLSINEAEKMAQYLQKVPQTYAINKIAFFDNNTSHIIGREWFEIDYDGEGMTWQKQQLKYQRYGITNFKTLDNLTKFFPIESQLPYFKKVYS